MIKVIVMGQKLNVVDSNNNLVGFDMEDDCCAHGGYFISEAKCSKDFSDQVGLSDIDYPKHVFDTDFFESIENIDKEGEAAVIFKMRPEYGWGEEENGKALFLHLFNTHNGYYSKGFKASFNEINTGNV